MKFNLMTDSCCDLPYETLKDNDIEFVSMIITIDGQEYIDDLGKTLKTDWLIDQLKQEKMPTSSQINVGTYVEAFQNALDKGRPVLYLAFSSGLSGSYYNAVTAKQMIEEAKGKEVPLQIIDTQAACLGEGLLVLEALRLRNEGKTLEETVTFLEDKKRRLHSWVTVDDLKHLERGGRISKTSATVASVLKIKPIIHVNAQGKLVNVGKARGRKKPLDYLVTETAKTIVAPETQDILIAYAGDQPAADYTKEKLLATIPVKNVRCFPMGPAIASHTGAGALAIFSFGKLKA